MSIEVVVQKKEPDGFSLWINEEQGFNTHSFLNAIAPLEIRKTERILESFGPAEIIDEYHTVQGVFSIHYEFDEYAGTTIYSGNSKLMEVIWTHMLASKDFHQRR